MLFLSSLLAVTSASVILPSNPNNNAVFSGIFAEGEGCRKDPRSALHCSNSRFELRASYYGFQVDGLELSKDPYSPLAYDVRIDRKNSASDWRFALLAKNSMVFIAADQLKDEAFIPDADALVLLFNPKKNASGVLVLRHDVASPDAVVGEIKQQLGSEAVILAKLSDITRTRVTPLSPENCSLRTRDAPFKHILPVTYTYCYLLEPPTPEKLQFLYFSDGYADYLCGYDTIEPVGKSNMDRIDYSRLRNAANKKKPTPDNMKLCIFEGQVKFIPKPSIPESVLHFHRGFLVNVIGFRNSDGVKELSDNGFNSVDGDIFMWGKLVDPREIRSIFLSSSELEDLSLLKQRFTGDETPFRLKLIVKYSSPVEAPREVDGIHKLALKEGDYHDLIQEVRVFGGDDCHFAPGYVEKKSASLVCYSRKGSKLKSIFFTSSAVMTGERLFYYSYRNYIMCSGPRFTYLPYENADGYIFKDNTNYPFMFYRNVSDQNKLFTHLPIGLNGVIQDPLETIPLNDEPLEGYSGMLIIDSTIDATILSGKKLNVRELEEATRKVKELLKDKGVDGLVSILKFSPKQATYRIERFSDEIGAARKSEHKLAAQANKCQFNIREFNVSVHNYQRCEYYLGEEGMFLVVDGKIEDDLVKIVIRRDGIAVFQENFGDKMNRDFTEHVAFMAGNLSKITDRISDCPEIDTFEPCLRVVIDAEGLSYVRSETTGNFKALRLNSNGEWPEMGRRPIIYDPQTTSEVCIYNTRVKYHSLYVVIKNIGPPERKTQ